MLKKNMWFFEEPSDSGGAPDAVKLMPPVGEPEGDPTDDGSNDVEETPEPEPGGDEPAASAAPATSVDAAALAREFGSVIAEQFKQNAPAAPKDKPLTPEEAKKLLNVWEPDDAFVARFGNLETQKAAIVEMRDALLKQFDTVSQMRLNEMKQQIELKVNPVAEMMAQQEGQHRQERFTKQFPQLAKPELMPLVQAVGQQLAAQGKKFTDEKSMFTALATGCEAVIKATNPGFKLSAQSAPTRAGRIPVTSSGSGGASGGSGGDGDGVKTPKAVSFLPKVR